MSYVNIAIFHNDLISFISGCRKILIFIFGLCGQCIIKVRNIYEVVMHIYRDRLYGVNITGQHEYGDTN